MPTEQEIADAKAAEEKAAADAATKKALESGESIVVKKADWEKLESDRNNYRDATLKQKREEEARLEKERLEKEAAGGSGGDDVPDEKTIATVATESARKVQHEVAEKTAKRAFLAKHSEYADDAQWVELMANFTKKGDESTPEEILDRFDAALIEHKRKTGKLEEYLRSQGGRSVDANQTEIRGMGGNGDRNNPDNTGSLTPKGQEMTGAMHNDPEKVKKINVQKDSVISKI